MKIALVCPASLPATQFGGIMFLSLDIAKESAKLGHNVTIFTTDMDFANNPNTFNKKLPRIETIDNFKISRSHVWFSIKLFFINPKMYFQMMDDDPDIIHAMGVRSFQSFIAALVSKKKKIPLVISDQGGLTTHPDLKNGLKNRLIYRLQNPMIHFIIKQASKIIAANEYEKKIFTTFCEKSKISIVRNGINLDSFNIDLPNFRDKYKIHESFILFLGRFNKIKGIDLLLHAFSLIKDKPELSKIKLVIMGVDFGFESEMFRLINKLNLNKNVLVIKNPPREYVMAAYKESKFLVLPSRWELSPLTPLEGFVFKKAVISTNTHGIPFTIENGKNGILVDLEDYSSLSKAIFELVTNEKKCLEYGLNGYNLVHDTCNSKIMVEQSIKIYEKLINS